MKVMYTQRTRAVLQKVSLQKVSTTKGIGIKGIATKGIVTKGIGYKRYRQQKVSIFISHYFSAPLPAQSRRSAT